MMTHMKTTTDSGLKFTSIPRPAALRSIAAVGFAVLAATAAVAVAPIVRADDPAADSSPPALSIVERVLIQEQGSWVVNYRLRYHGKTGMIVTPTEILARLDGWVSNSRVNAHSLPRMSSLVVSGAESLVGTSDVVLAADDAQRCRERATLRVRLDIPSTADSEVVPASHVVSSPNRVSPPPPDKQPILSVAPEDALRVRIKLDHLHYVYGDYDPLLGVRSLELTLGAATLRDTLPLDREQYFAQPIAAWPDPPEDRRDTRYFISGPDSLHLEAHIPGNQYYRFPERPVRYGTKMKLSYYYFIAGGTEGDCRARITQYKETPTQWRSLYDGCHEDCLTTIGRWVKVERIFRTEADATSLALDFRISGADVGEMWIDNVRLEPVHCPDASRP